MSTIDLSKCSMREDAHFNGGAGWFGYRHRCIQYPRLTRFDKYLRNTRSVESTFEVDGEPVASLEEAARLLATPYVPIPEDIALLELVPDDWTMLDRRARFLRLRDFGLVEFRDGECRRTDAGREAVKGNQS